MSRKTKKQKALNAWNRVFENLIKHKKMKKIKIPFTDKVIVDEKFLTESERYKKILDKYKSTLEFALQNVVNKLKYSIRSYPAKKRPLSGNNYSDIEVPQIRVTNKDLHTILYENFASVKYINKHSVNLF